MAGLGARGGSDSPGSEVPWHAEVPLAQTSCRLSSSTEHAPRREGRGPATCARSQSAATQRYGSGARRRLRASVLRWAEVTGVPVRPGVRRARRDKCSAEATCALGGAVETEAQPR
ncbi:uncharacterized protein LOC116091275 [Mastomys coucha]|uniref:uncharacterized protein LOC116091275 n=1 Tax=Mastomys coucha TaxID=35658 RepID=UPI001261E3F4|nr:uncharacterized protein LOC116091275 [Mastomys coucha]